MQIQTVNYDLVTTWCGGMASRTRCQSITGDRSQSHVIDSDEPVSLGGEGRAPGPQDLLLAAFNACMTAAFVQEAIGAGITLTHLDIETHGELLTGISRYCEKPQMPLLAGCNMSFTSAGMERPISLNTSISGSLTPP